jgi:hypothetical protein
MWTRDGVRFAVSFVEGLVVQVGRIVAALEGDEADDPFELAALRRRIHEGDVTWPEGASRSSQREWYEYERSLT